MIINRRSQKKFNNQNGVNRSPLYDLSVYSGVLSWRKIKMTERKPLQVGQRFGKLTVIGLDHIQNYTRKDNGKNQRFFFYRCVCDCGNETVVQKSDLTKGSIKSCGCGLNPIIHGGTGTRLFVIWQGIKRRCNAKKGLNYKNYVLRGITICDEWKDNFKIFSDWAMLNGYNPNAKRGECTIDRIDNNKGYSPDNCRWVNQTIQARNTRKNKLITYNGETHCISEWAEILNISPNTLYARIIIKKWDIEKALTQTTERRKLITYKGATKSIKEWADEYGLKFDTLHGRLFDFGWTIEEALTIPVGQKRKKKE